MTVLRYYGRRALAALRNMRARGYAPLPAVLFHLSRATLLPEIAARYRVEDAQLRRRYARRLRPFRSAIDVRAVMPMTPRNFDLMTRLDELVERLGASIARCRPMPATDASASHTD